MLRGCSLYGSLPIIVRTAAVLGIWNLEFVSVYIMESSRSGGPREVMNFMAAVSWFWAVLQVTASRVVVMAEVSSSAKCKRKVEAKKSDVLVDERLANFTCMGVSEHCQARSPHEAPRSFCLGP